MIYGIPVTRFVRELYKEISEDDIFNGAAALGFYLTLALFPAIIFVMAVIPYLPIANVDVAIMDLLRQVMPASAADMVSGVVEEVTANQSGGLLSFGALATIWAASSGMVAIIQQLNVTYDVGEGRNFVKVRALAIGLSVLFGLMVVAAFTLIVVGGIAQEWIGEHYGVSTAVLMLFAALRWAIILGLLLLGFALIYYLAPDVKQDFRFITPGALLGVLLLAIASLGFSLYVSRFADYSATYGSIGAVIILMLWLYIAGLVILLGSEINALVEHYAPHGKEKGEKREGEKPDAPAGRKAPPPPPPPRGAEGAR